VEASDKREDSESGTMEGEVVRAENTSNRAYRIHRFQSRDILGITWTFGHRLLQENGL